MNVKTLTFAVLQQYAAILLDHMTASALMDLG